MSWCPLWIYSSPKAPRTSKHLKQDSKFSRIIRKVLNSLYSSHRTNHCNDFQDCSKKFQELNLFEKKNVITWIMQRTDIEHCRWISKAIRYHKKVIELTLPHQICMQKEWVIYRLAQWTYIQEGIKHTVYKYKCVPSDLLFRTSVMTDCI